MWPRRIWGILVPADGRNVTFPGGDPWFVKDHGLDRARSCHCLSCEFRNRVWGSSFYDRLYTTHACEAIQLSSVDTSWELSHYTVNKTVRGHNGAARRESIPH